MLPLSTCIRRRLSNDIVDWPRRSRPSRLCIKRRHRAIAHMITRSALSGLLRGCHGRELSVILAVSMLWHLTSPKKNQKNPSPPKRGNKESDPPGFTCEPWSLMMVITIIIITTIIIKIIILVPRPMKGPIVLLSRDTR